MAGFIEHLRRRLDNELPGVEAQYRMAPRGRPRPGDAQAATRCQQSAVLLYLFPDEDDWHVVLMKRTAYDGHHSGQISIPGGRLEPGEDHRQAALREFSEEIGVPVEPGQVIGGLSDLFIPTSNFLVRPFVAHAAYRPAYLPDPVEVDRVIEMRISALVSEQTVQRRLMRLSSGAEVETPYFDVDGYQVWGATAMILNEFKVLLGELQDLT